MHSRDCDVACEMTDIRQAFCLLHTVSCAEPVASYKCPVKYFNNVHGFSGINSMPAGNGTWCTYFRHRQLYKKGML